jgi:hypothetical protein
MLKIDRFLPQRKAEVLAYFRARASEAMSETRQRYGENQPKERAKDVNRASTTAYVQLADLAKLTATTEGWPREELLSAILLLNYANAVVMIETRNDVWPYDYMSFSRRMGELWQPFCKLCFEMPLTFVEPTLPPLFRDVKEGLMREVSLYIEGLNISPREKNDLKTYYDKVWVLVNSGEVNLALDLHFQFEGTRYAVDFKSAFGSNEKGNTNRLLLVASIYRAVEPGSKCLLWVRAAEDQNNAYFRTLQRSGVWNAFCGEETYKQIAHFSGFDLMSWIATNVDWMADLDAATAAHINLMGLERYARW